MFVCFEVLRLEGLSRARASQPFHSVAYSRSVLLEVSLFYLFSVAFFFSCVFFVLQVTQGWLASPNIFTMASFPRVLLRVCLSCLFGLLLSLFFRLFALKKCLTRVGQLFYGSVCSPCSAWGLLFLFHYSGKGYEAERPIMSVATYNFILKRVSIFSTLFSFLFVRLLVLDFF